MSMNHDKLPFSSLSELAEADSGQRAGKAPRIENSGLLDLRQMARVYDKQNQPRGRDQDAIPELVTVGIGTPPGLMLPLPAPPDVEQQKQEAQRNRLLYVMSAVAGVLGLAAIALAFVLLRGGFLQSAQAGAPGPQQVGEPAGAQAGEPAQPAAGAIAGSPAVAGDTEQDEQDGQDERGAAASEQAEPGESTPNKAARDDAGEDRATTRKSRRSERRERRSRDRDNERESRRAAAPEPAPAAPRKDKCMDEIACELAPNPPACCSRYKSRDSGSGGLLSVSGTRRASADDDLPARLERSDISAGMDKVQGSVASCRASHPVKGTVKVSIKVGGDGKVDSARVVSSPTEGLGACVASKVRGARFARTQRGATFSYPFIFN